MDAIFCMVILNGIVVLIIAFALKIKLPLSIIVALISIFTVLSCELPSDGVSIVTLGLITSLSVIVTYSVWLTIPSLSIAQMVIL